jgi:hypothetical protein
MIDDFLKTQLKSIKTKKSNSNASEKMNKKESKSNIKQEPLDLTKPKTELNPSTSTSVNLTACYFENGLIPHEIVGATESKLDQSNGSGKLLFLMKWKNSSKVDLVLSSSAKKVCPQLVIDFYEKHLVWGETVSN